MTRLRRWWSKFLWLVTAEFLLKWFANCGPLIVGRTIITSLILFAVCLWTRSAIDPTRSWALDCNQARLDMLDHESWFGALFAGVYIALYTRFASQWAYLAGLYNQIKQTECVNAEGKVNARALAEWKAGFIEDARELHLARKPLFATTIRRWWEEPGVREALEKHAKSSKRELDDLYAELADVARFNSERPPAVLPSAAALESKPPPAPAPTRRPAAPTDSSP